MSKLNINNYTKAETIKIVYMTILKFIACFHIMLKRWYNY